MKLAEALSLRKAQITQLSNILGQIASNAYSHEKEDDPNRLVAKYLALVEEHVNLVERINRTNQETIVNGKSLADWRVRRDSCIEASGGLNKLPSKKRMTSYDNQSIVHIALDTAQVRTVADDFARQAREIDNLLQQSNWNTELVGG